MPGLFDRFGRLAGAAADGARALANQLDKARLERHSDTPGGRNSGSASSGDAPVQKPVREARSMFADPYDLQSTFGYKDRATQVSYNTLRELMYRVPIVSSIISVRTEQVASFGHVAPDKYSLGFRVKLRDNKKGSTSSSDDLCRQCEQFLLRTGVRDTPQGHDSFETYLRKITRDALVFDQNCTEIVPANDGRPGAFYAVDAANIRIASNLRNYMPHENFGENAAYVELWNESVRASYTAQEMIFGVRNPSTDIRLNGYGTSELEYLLTTITQILNAWNYNANVFENGTMARGLLNIKDTDISSKDLNNFTQHWDAMLRGVENAHRIPVINSAQGVDYINLQGVTDEGYREWLDFLIKCACGAFRIAPEEINLNYGQIGQTQTLSEDSNRDKITASKERGLRPLLRHISGNINTHLIWPLSEEVEFEFVGLDSMGAEERADFNNKRVRSIATLNEVRASEDLEPLPGGDVVLDGIYMQSLMQSQGQQQMPGFGDWQQQGQPTDDTQQQQQDPMTAPVTLPSVLEPFVQAPSLPGEGGPTGVAQAMLPMAKSKSPLDRKPRRPIQLDIRL